MGDRLFGFERRLERARIRRRVCGVSITKGAAGMAQIFAVRLP